jgi:hypothetical protein
MPNPLSSILHSLSSYSFSALDNAIPATILLSPYLAAVRLGGYDRRD